MEKRTVSADLDFDASEITPTLFQGSKPPIGDVLKRHGFAAVVLCADEHQISKDWFEGVEVIHAPNDDDPGTPPTRDQMQIALGAAKKVQALIEAGHSVLVTCAAGLNRSGLVNGLAMNLVFGWSGKKCVERIQERRDGALFNRQFVKVLERLTARKNPVTYRRT